MPKHGTTYSQAHSFGCCRALCFIPGRHGDLQGMCFVCVLNFAVCSFVCTRMRSSQINALLVDLPICATQSLVNVKQQLLPSLHT